MQNQYEKEIISLLTTEYETDYLIKLKEETIKLPIDKEIMAIILSELDTLIALKSTTLNIKIEPTKITEQLLNLYNNKKLSKETIFFLLFHLPCLFSEFLTSIYPSLTENDYYTLYRLCPVGKEEYLMEIFDLQINGVIKEKMDKQILITDYGRILKNC